LGHALKSFFAAMPAHGPAFYGKLVFGFLFVIAILAALQFAPRRSRKGIIAAFTFLGGLYYAAEFFWPAHDNANPLTPYQDLVSQMTTVVSSFAVGVGVLSLLSLHARLIARQRAGWGNSVVLIVAFLAMTVFGLLNEYRPTLRVLGSGATAHDVFQFLFKGGLTNLGAAMFSILGFYIASAAYRAFRVRSFEAGLLMGAALIVMLGAVGFGTFLTGWIPLTVNGAENPWANFRIEQIAQWLLMEINSAAYRGILFGLTIGLLAASLRLWLSLERGAYFEKEL
jgi:hypothetical protein